MKSDVDLYLGIHFDYLPNGDVKITQPKLLQGLLEEYKDELAMHRARVPIHDAHEEPCRASQICQVSSFGGDEDCFRGG